MDNKKYTITLDIRQLIKLETILQLHLEQSLQFKDASVGDDYFTKVYEREAKEAAELIDLAKEAFEKRWED